MSVPLLLILSPAFLAPTSTLSELRLRSSGGTFAVASTSELQAAERLFAGLLSPNRDVAQLTRLAAGIQLELITLDELGEELLVLREPEADKRGRGFYVFRTRSPSLLALQAPHSNDDAHTGFLVERCFLETRAAAAAWNSVDRHQPVPGGRGTADLAHLDDSYFVAFTRAFAAAQTRGILLQVHGYARSERKTDAGRLADAILSNGSKSPPKWIFECAARLQSLNGGKVAVYPEHVTELGATTNSQGKVLRDVRHAGFLHLEMALELRQRLKSSARDRKAFWRCLPEAQP